MWTLWKGRDTAGVMPTRGSVMRLREMGCNAGDTHVLGINLKAGKQTCVAWATPKNWLE